MTKRMRLALAALALTGLLGGCVAYPAYPGYGYGYGHYGQEGGHSEKAVTAADEARQPKLTNARVDG